MLIVHETTDFDSALQSLKKTHRREIVPTSIKEVYRPFWLGKALYHAQNRNKQPVDGTVVFLADARILNWRVIGAYQYRLAEGVLDLREHQVDFVVSDQEPHPDAEVFEPMLNQTQLSTRTRLMSTRRLLARTLKLGKIEFEDNVEYHLIYRPYWEIEFQNRRGEPDVALISRDNLLVRK